MNAANIATESSNVNTLQERAAAIKREFDASKAAGHDRIEHMIAAGKHVIAVQERIGRGLRRWLKEYGLSKTDAYDAMLLARNKESVRSSGHSSVAAVLRTLRAKSGKGSDSKTAKPKETLARLWKREKAERTAFLDEIGVDGFRQAMSLPFYRQLRDLVRVEKTESTPSGKGSMLAKKALSHIKAADKEEVSEAERQSNLNEAWNCLRAILKIAGNDPHSVSLGLEAAKKKAAA